MRLAKQHTVDAVAEKLHNNMMLGAAQAVEKSGFRAILVFVPVISVFISVFVVHDMSLCIVCVGWVQGQQLAGLHMFRTCISSHVTIYLGYILGFGVSNLPGHHGVCHRAIHIQDLCFVTCYYMLLIYVGVWG